MSLLFILSIFSLVKCFQYRYDIPTFSHSGFFPVDVGLNDMTGFYLAALGDFNSDFRTDLVMISEDKRTIRIYFWNSEKFGFLANPMESLFDEEIVNIVASDFDYDGKLDLVIYSIDRRRSEGLLVRICFDPTEGIDILSSCRTFPSTLSLAQPVVLDFYGNRRVQLFGKSVNQKGKSSTLWEISSPSNRSVSESNVVNDIFCETSNPNWNSFVDFDGDCSADIFLTCNDGTFRILLNGGQGKYSIGFQGKLLDGTNAIHFSDIDGNGSVDILALVCINENSRCSIYVLYNQRSSDGLCQKGSGTLFYSFDKADSIISLTDLVSAPVTLKTSKISSNVVLGDMNLDSYPDLSIAVQIKNDHPVVILLENVPCEAIDKLPSSTCNDDKRGFRLFQSGTDYLGNYNVEQIGLMDLSERGKLDLLVVIRKDGKLKLNILFNNYYSDAFFLKAIMTNGVCYKQCTGQARQKPLGTNYPGATFMFEVFDTNGKKRPALAVQSPSYGYFSLSKPYVFVGLGRTNNFIDKFVVGVSGGSTYSWSGIMPNAQLLVHPPTSTAADSRYPDWILELYLRPSDYALNVLITLIISAGLLSFMVGLLRYLEKVGKLMDQLTCINSEKTKKKKES